MKYLLICLTLLVSCSSIKTSFDYDKHADFTRYKTYSYARGARTLPVAKENNVIVLKAIDRELTSRGFTKVDSAADVVIDLLVRTQGKLTPKDPGTPVWQYGYGYGFGPGFSSTDIDVNEFTEGTLFIIMANPKDDHMLWQGRGTKGLKANATAERMEENINKAVTAIFENFPIKAK